MFKGSIVALITPMKNDGSVDYEELASLVEWHIESGTNAIVAVGTTGESATLPFEEHIQVVKRVVEYVNCRVPVIAGNGANSTAEGVYLTKELAKCGVDGFLCVVPYYNKPQQRGLIRHYQVIADSSELPQLLYNVPGRTVLDMNADTVAELSRHKNIIGIKEATGDIDRLKEIRQKVSEDFLLLSGDDMTCLEFMKNGGHGVISVTANVAPKMMADMCRFALAGEIQEAHSINDRLDPLHHGLFIESNPVMPKWCLHKMNRIKTAAVRLPLVEPSEESQKEVESIMSKAL